MQDIQSKTYYELLGVAPEASREEIKQSYREIARIYHPDSNYFDEILGALPLPKQPTDNDETFKTITNAYNILMDEEKRAAYDAILPKNLASWDEDSIPSGFDDGRFQGTVHLASDQTPAHKRAPAFGTFGAEQSTPSTFDSDGDSEPSSVADQLNGGIIRRLMRLLGKR